MENCWYERPDPEDNTQTITENRIKIVRNSSISQDMDWDSNTQNDWTNASLNTFLNGDFYNASGDGLYIWSYSISS